MSEQEQLTRILMLVELTNSRLDQLNRDIKEANHRIQEEVKRWDERFFQLVKEQGQTARTIIIAAASVVVVSPVLGAVVDLVSRFLPQ
jgi:MerR family transcriptional regulator, repressor of the yfmOP operon